MEFDKNIPLKKEKQIRERDMNTQTVFMEQIHDEMEIGDSTIVAIAPDGSNSARSILDAYTRKKGEGKKFSWRRQHDMQDRIGSRYFRVWRVK